MKKKAELKKIEVFECKHKWGNWETICNKESKFESWLLIQERVCSRCGMRQVKKDVL